MVKVTGKLYAVNTTAKENICERMLHDTDFAFCLDWRTGCELEMRIERESIPLLEHFLLDIEADTEDDSFVRVVCPATGDEYQDTVWVFSHKKGAWHVMTEIVSYHDMGGLKEMMDWLDGLEKEVK